MYRSDDQVGPAVAVAEKLGLAVDIAKLPDGYDTFIDDGSTNALPGGVRQRIALARVLATEPRLILFDEANNSLDQASDGYLMEYLQSLRGKSTLLMISHRPSILRLADRTYIMADGALTPWRDPFRASQRPRS